MPGNSQAHVDVMAMRDKRAAEDHVGKRGVQPAAPVEEAPAEVVEAEVVEAE